MAKRRSKYIKCVNHPDITPQVDEAGYVVNRMASRLGIKWLEEDHILFERVEMIHVGYRKEGLIRIYHLNGSKKFKKGFVNE